ncbi:MAG TPA: hypothetical protein VIN17_07705, partial [Paracoccaceae bacterium]
YLAQIESGARNLSLKHQQKISLALGVDPKSLVDFNANTDDEVLIQEAFATLTGEQRRFWIELAKSVLKSHESPTKKV